MLPLFITMAFLFMLILSAGYMMRAVADEKENRTLEVLVTSISPGRLIAGKILGIVAISLTLLLAWSLVVISGVFLAVQMGVGWFEDLTLDWRGVLGTIIIAIPAYVLAVALMTAIGAMVTTTQEGQSVGMIFFFLFAAPLYVSWIYLDDPHRPFAVILSLLPFTAL
jgi:ABC-2 type transport system permease protein